MTLRHSIRRRAAGVLALATALACGTAQAQPRAAISDDVVKLGMLLDMSGLYADVTGRGSATAAQMAIDDFGGKVLGKKIELVVVDHQNKADIAANKAREWYDTGNVDAILDVAASAPALAVLEVAKQKNRIVVFSGPGTERITNDLCTPVSVHYAYDTYALANTTARATVQRGGKSWFFLTADYAFGHTLQDSATAVINETGGKVVGAARHPIGASDFASYLLQAQASKAQIVGLANAGGDAINAIKAASEFGLTRNHAQRMAGLLLYVNDIHALGLKTTAGLLLTEGFYWDMNDATRAWSRRYFEKLKKMPNMSQAGAYSSVMHYLKAVQAAGTDETAAVMKQMKSMPINDFFAKNGRIREDGRMIHDMYLFEVKTPAESKYPWDYYKVVATVPGEQAFMPAAKSKCPLLRP
ncbi:ABC transporter substrate-binding protein [Cupriavidus taiwanensis]|uniref:Putative SUBSTRATE-BINDING PERIPLASMIC (PBP) ABC TRANSPORTER PROTEIN, ABC-type branched-chain amino acid transport systems family n=1 Tax=Cupriavidus taiwanensis TaxID=164546 RepID=A0A7Z7JCT3_9BURK|nr:ABC transporter substrate-binding protein [Cupriavidus taiwanensis]SOZ09920.1 putative SUBSTRATE-BINDING PERIPLASMIC (PBP) ABC TRANSPORTER PROTEIN, ABC-type branched-chain amino acid transport systems family [Cupriavidus taiwanensis]SOZ12034.1 putative SUBSTRATE-BINDING PERIPLASMIC (PBP) ABC TRANSPORTER PROTEIN, ABC-type branched-chain amino acid transport systems family [Cupriavidus taiwanensis]SOZ43393.1 putative SUBSTRATE-BINDING PERIPLASMIC (PBP) ABC TRANSPORTER PROTEIN, ABC-type branched